MTDDFKFRVKEEGDPEQEIIIFQKNVLKIQCFRKSFICGICVGVVGGLACFLGTSKVLFSTNMAVASVWVGVLGYWFPCRLNHERQWKKSVLFQEGLKKKFQGGREQSVGNETE